MEEIRALEPQVPKKQLNCYVCNKTGFSTMYKLKSHLFGHNAVPPRYNCKYCVKSFYRTDIYKRHMKTHSKDPKLYECDYCARTFADKRNLKTHLQNVHDDICDQPNLRYQCTECDINYCEERLLKHHIRKVHLKINTSDNHILRSVNETWIEHVKNTKSCIQITKVQPNKLTIKSCHIKRKSEVKSKREMNLLQQFKASEFASKDNYYSKAVCDYCGKEMLKKSIIVHIRERHLKLRRFSCELCGQTFKRNYQLCLHRCKGIKKEEK